MTDSCLNLRPHPSYFSAVTSAFHSAHDTSMEEAFPSRFLPRPLMISELEAVNTVLDPKLLVTPERRPPSLVQLHHPSPEDDQFYHRTTRVHFDQNVSVHHILPECANSSESTDDGSCNRMDSTDCVACPELDLTTLSDSEPISVVASDLRNLSVPLRSGFSASNKSSIKKFSCTTSSVDDKRGKFNANDKSRQVIGGTQRTESHKCADNAKQKLDISLPKSDGARGSPLESYGHQNAMVKRSFSSPMVVPETGSTDGLSLADAVMLTSPPSEPGLQCVLAKPELNTTLKMNREIEQIKQQEFDLPAVVKEKINPKLKAKVLEKVRIRGFD